MVHLSANSRRGNDADAIQMAAGAFYRVVGGWLDHNVFCFFFWKCARSMGFDFRLHIYDENITEINTLLGRPRL